MHALRGVTLRGRRYEAQPHVNPADHENVVIGLLDLADRVAREPIAVRLDVARLQRASEGAGQSAGRGGDHIVEGRRARLDRPGGDLVMVGAQGWEKVTALESTYLSKRRKS